MSVNPDWFYRCDPTSFRKLELQVEELHDMIATLEQENRQLHARNARLEKEQDKSTSDVNHMSLTINELFDRLKELDELSILEILNISSEEIVQRFQDEIEEHFDKLVTKFEDEDNEIMGREEGTYES